VKTRAGAYLNVTVQAPVRVGPPQGRTSVGLDLGLGLKDFAATSDGRVLEAQRFLVQ